MLLFLDAIQFIERPSSIIRIVSGLNVTLTCSVRSALYIELAWSYSNSSDIIVTDSLFNYTDNNRSIVWTSVLEINDLRIEDNGTVYVCEAFGYLESSNDSSVISNVSTQTQIVLLCELNRVLLCLFILL